MDQAAGRRTVAVVLAGGVGTRMGQDRPKQLLEIAGRSMLEHSVAAFQRCEQVEEILVVMAADWVDVVARLVATAGFEKVSAVIPGGSSRSQSTRSALAVLGDVDCNVLIHDAARPLVDQPTIERCLAALSEVRAVTVASGSIDTIVVVDADLVVDIPVRASLRRVQTPQGFRLRTLRAAYALAAADGDLGATDDCSVVRRYLPDEPIRVVAGSDRNLKVTLPQDLLVAEQILRMDADQPAEPPSP